jgi:hypothetical protein
MSEAGLFVDELQFRPVDLEFLMKRYQWELERKDKLTSAVSIPVTILAALGGLDVAMTRSFKFSAESLSALFLIALIADAVTASFCLFWLGRNYAGSAYVYLPPLQEIEEDRVRLEEDKDMPPEAFEAVLRHNIISTTDTNAETNDARSAFMDRSNQALVGVMVASAATAVIYVLSQFR